MSYDNKRMIPIYKYTRSWQSWHIHAPSSEEIMFVPKYNVILAKSGGGTFANPSYVICEDEKMLEEAHKVVEDIAVDITISNFQQVEYSDENIKKLINNLRERNRINKEIASECELLQKVKPATVALIRLKYDVKYFCSCKKTDDCEQRKKHLEEQILILPNDHYEKTLRNLNYKIETGTMCGESKFPKLRYLSSEIIKDVPYSTEFDNYLTFDDFVKKNIKSS